MDNLGDLSSIIESINSDPDMMSQLSDIADKLGLGSANGGFRQEQSGTDEKEGHNATQTASEHSKSDAPLFNDLLPTITALAPRLSALSQQDDTARLLSALRPFLSEEKGKRIDKAGQMLLVLKAINLLKDTGQSQ